MIIFLLYSLFISLNFSLISYILFFTFSGISISYFFWIIHVFFYQGIIFEYIYIDFFYIIYDEKNR